MRGFKLYGYFGIDERKSLEKHANRIMAYGYVVKIVKEKHDFGDGVLVNQVAVYSKPIVGRAKIINQLKGLRHA